MKRNSKWFECKNKERLNKKRFLIIVNVLGSAGPLRFIVNEEDVLGGVIQTALKLYAKEGRLPVLGYDNSKFLIYCANLGSDALRPWDEVGCCGARNFVLCKKPEQQSNMSEARSNIISRKGYYGNWKAWLSNTTLRLGCPTF